MLGRLTEWLATSAQCEEAPEKVRFLLSRSDCFRSFLLDPNTFSLFFILGEIFYALGSSVGRDPPAKMHRPVPLSFSFL